ncbi:[LysW]-aminoadipate semialdehyde transaminase LysJ [Thermus scotoductus]|uniref:[LysW]-aminoadipate semialdehyde transaminase n=1 Tax=Thermus scotoductus TaxID=37636 RepID=A0A430RH54_THESC|nr:[LysW]-aminoadipate semialdehyde transaminase LysJ [Thermus scotoductus]RTG98751.1 acetylornithine aminotransferase [Thermus scotoductus]RTH07612.1 acetylornithine aminotransferase [Thermus scotoductus]RTH23767.1 acetylornithine aminotransferase [Thermus scotoductus]RTI03287.1 acetylornithine aminotransferase [Thermus scotoductus]RTI17235.1 acetylornithine aminotransferase [Thermus scotoductus]
MVGVNVEWRTLLEAEKSLDTGVYTKHDLLLVRGQGARVWDAEGHEYIDCVGGYGVANLGHANPEVVEAIKKQAETLLSMPQTLPTPMRGEFYRTLVSLLPPELNRVFPTNSGTEANEAAIKFAWAHTKKRKLVAAMRGFSGRTLGSLSVTWEPKYREPFMPLLGPVEFIPFNDVEALRKAVDEETAAVILEPVQGEGGVRPATREFLEAAREITREKGALLILDEIQTGMGRTGRRFAFEHYGVVPDILTLAKALGGGVPIGVAVMREEVAKSMPKGGHGTTFGGNPLAMAAGVAALRYLERTRLWERAAELGPWFMEKLREIPSPKIREVRGLGLMVGLELKEKAAPYIERLEKEHRVLTLQAGPTVIRFLPPLVIEKADLERVVEAVRAVLT